VGTTSLLFLIVNHEATPDREQGVQFDTKKRNAMTEGEILLLRGGRKRKEENGNRVIRPGIMPWKKNNRQGYKEDHRRIIFDGRQSL